MNDPKHALLARAASLVEKTAAPMLWKYTDEDGKDFYLSEKRTGTVKSPYSGKSFTPKPTRSSLSDVGKELKQDDAKVKGSLWKYVDGEGKEFYLPERLTGTLKSPYSGKSFSPKAEKSTLSDVGKELKQDAKAEKKAAEEDPEQEQQGQSKKATSEEQWDLASEIIKQGENHPALAAIKKQYDAILEGVKTAAKRSAAMKRIGVGRTEDPTFVLTEVKPEIEKLSKVSDAVAKQLVQRLTGSGKW